jgi:hypothetical protein
LHARLLQRDIYWICTTHTWHTALLCVLQMRLVLESLQGQLLDTRVSLAVLEGRSLRLDNPMLLQRISALLAAAEEGEAEAAGAAPAAAMEVDAGQGAQGQDAAAEAACCDGAVAVGGVEGQLEVAAV